jgi:hypothetical protein
MALIVLLFGTALGIHLGLRYTVQEAMCEVRAEYQQIDRQDEYWECLQSMLAEAVAWVNEHDPADWWKYGESAPS